MNESTGASRRAETGPFPRSWRAGAWRQRVATPNERCRSTSWDHVAARVFNNSNARPEQGVLRRPHRSEGLYIEATVLLNVTINTKKLPGTVQRSGGPLLESSRCLVAIGSSRGLAWLPAPGGRRSYTLLFGFFSFVPEGKKQNRMLRGD